ncbi:MAG TPA: FGGY family carbohydrate kinase [Kofleriaceae bacterium]|nr:FGGY family carbohydrate kinase [Kofleriaceae bacterium]
MDIGTQGLKVVVTDDELAVLGEASEVLAVHHPRPGWAEQAPGDWERALAPAIAAALQRAAVDPSEVRALAVAGQLDGCVAVDAAGEAMGPCLIGMDRRAEGCVPDGLEALDLGVIPDGGHLGAKARWLARAGVGAARFHQPVSYLVARLTGEHVFDHGLASTTMLYAPAQRDYDDDALALFEIERAQLPRIDEATACAGRLHAAGAALTGLPLGIPVAVGTGDDLATPLGAGIIAPGAVVCVLGTAEVVGALHPTPLRDPARLVQALAYPGGCSFIENPGWLSGGALAWLTRILGGDFAALDAAAGGVPPGADGVTFVPALSGAMAPEWIAAGRGAWTGLTAAHGRGHLVRAVMEGCAFAMRDVIERLDALGVATVRVVLLGGGARSTVWPVMRADLTGRRVDVFERVDTCPVGAAMLAAVAADIQPDLATCARAVAQPSRTVEPDPATRAAYDEAYQRYRRTFGALATLWND